MQHIKITSKDPDDQGAIDIYDEIMSEACAFVNFLNDLKQQVDAYQVDEIGQIRENYVHYGYIHGKDNTRDGLGMTVWNRSMRERSLIKEFIKVKFCIFMEIFKMFLRTILKYQMVIIDIVKMMKYLFI